MAYGMVNVPGVTGPELNKAIQQMEDKLLKEIRGAEPSQSGTLTYTGTEQTPVWDNYDPRYLDISGESSATNAGTYTAIFKPKQGYAWADGTTDAKEVQWTIGRAVVSVPPETFVVYGDEWTDGAFVMYPTDLYDSEKIEGGGFGIFTNVPDATFTPKANYMWPDGTTTEKTVSWTILPMRISAPSIMGNITLPFTGEAQSPVWLNVDENRIDVSGDVSGTAKGKYTAEFTPKTGYCWEDGSKTKKTIEWEIADDVMQGATATEPGKAGLVPAPEASSMNMFLTNKGTWHPYGDIVLCNKGNGLRMTRDLQGNYVLDVVFPFTQERLAAGVYQDSSFTAGVNKMNGYAIRTGSVVQAWFFGPIPLKKSLKGNDLEIYIGDLGALMDKSLVQWTAGRAFVSFRHMGQEMPEQGSPQCDLMLEPTGDNLVVRLIGSYSCEVLDADDNYEAYVSMYFSFPVKAS